MSRDRRKSDSVIFQNLVQNLLHLSYKKRAFLRKLLYFFFGEDVVVLIISVCSLFKTGVGNSRNVSSNHARLNKFFVKQGYHAGVF